jgi:hypothetical protein
MTTLNASAFVDGVRARIASHATADSWPERVASLHRLLLPLAAALALLASLGAGSAFAFAQHKRERTEFFADAYAVSVDPWLMHTSADQR